MMWLSRGIAIARNDVAILRRDPTAPIILLVMPLVVTAFIRPAITPILRQEGWSGVNGSEQAVPGMVLFFAFYMVAFAGANFFREFIWMTWQRLCALPLRRSEILLGKVVPTFALLFVQQSLLFAAGFALFGLKLRGSPIGLVVVSVAFSVLLTAFIVATVALCRTLQQVLAVANLSALLFAAMGGALTPIKTLPEWAAAVAPLSPIYWAMKGFNLVLLEGRDLRSVVAPVGVMLGMTVLLTIVAYATFRFDAEKGGTL